LSDSSKNPAPGTGILIVRAVFVPDGEQPPPDLIADFNSLHLPATLDPETGEITCDNAGFDFNGAVRAEWHPGDQQDQPGGDEPADQNRPGSEAGQ
jgi:hypothetical protein